MRKITWPGATQLFSKIVHVNEVIDDGRNTHARLLAMRVPFPYFQELPTHLKSLFGPETSKMEREKEPPDLPLPGLDTHRR